MRSIRIDSPAELPDVADALLEALDGRTIVALRGGMGAGKTTLVAALMERLGSADSVTSPTFALVNVYRTGRGEPVYHFDFYRIERLEEAFDLGYEEYFDSGALCLVEWPEKIEPLLPEGVMNVHIEIDSEQGRTFIFD